MVCFYPNYLGHSDNYIKPNVLLTPFHIAPEWYFLPYYAILRAVPYKGLGVLLLLGLIFILLILVIIPCSYIPGKFDEFYTISFVSFVIVFFKLMWLGGQPVTEPFIQITQFCSIIFWLFYFFNTNLLFCFNFYRFNFSK